MAKAKVTNYTLNVRHDNYDSVLSCLMFMLIINTRPPDNHSHLLFNSSLSNLISIFNQFAKVAQTRPQERFA